MGRSFMKKLFSKKASALIGLSILGLNLFFSVIALGPKVPPVEFLANAPTVENVSNHIG